MPDSCLTGIARIDAEKLGDCFVVAAGCRRSGFFRAILGHERRPVWIDRFYGLFTVPRDVKDDLPRMAA